MNKTLQQFDLDGRVIIITGGAGQLGREYAFTVGRAGGHAVIADLDQERIDGVCAAVLEETGVEAFGVCVDVSKKDSVQKMVQAVLGKYGRIDGLINNAALDPKFDKDQSGQHTNSFEDYPVELWNQGLAVNITGMFLCAQAVAPTMLAQEKGVIINVASTYGIVGPDQRLYQNGDGSQPPQYKPVTYSVTKSAAIGLTKYLATYWAGKGIRVNTLSPGGVMNGHEEGFVRRYSARTTLGRMADKTEYNAGLLYLLSDGSSYMTGSNLVVDGGWTTW